MAYQTIGWQAREGVNLNKFRKVDETSTSVVLVNDPYKNNNSGNSVFQPILQSNNIYFM